MTHLLQGAHAFCDEARRMTDMLIELASINEAIAYLATEISWGSGRNWTVAQQNLTPVDALVSELRRAHHKLKQDLALLSDLREQFDAALAHIPDTTACMFPLWAVDVFARPPRRVAIANAADQAYVRQAYLTYSAALTVIAHMQLPPLMKGLEQSATLVCDMREAMRQL